MGTIYLIVLELASFSSNQKRVKYGQCLLWVLGCIAGLFSTFNFDAHSTISVINWALTSGPCHRLPLNKSERKEPET